MPEEVKVANVQVKVSRAVDPATTLEPVTKSKASNVQVKVSEAVNISVTEGAG